MMRLFNGFFKDFVRFLSCRADGLWNLSKEEVLDLFLKMKFPPNFTTEIRRQFLYMGILDADASAEKYLTELKSKMRKEYDDTYSKEELILQIRIFKDRDTLMTQDNSVSQKLSSHIMSLMKEFAPSDPLMGVKDGYLSTANPSAPKSVSDLINNLIKDESEKPPKSGMN